MATRYVNHDTVHVAHSIIGERFYLPTLTKPDMVLPLKDLVERYVRNPDSANVKQGVFTDDLDVARLANMDKLDRAQAALDFKASAAQTRQELFDRAQERKRIKEEKDKAAKEQPVPVPDSQDPGKDVNV